MNNIVLKTVYKKLRPLKQGTLIPQLYILQNIHILQLLKTFSQANSKQDKHFSFHIKKKSSLGLSSNIIPTDFLTVNNISIDDMKQEQISAVKAYQGNVR